jgi:ribosomal protein S1/HrpA-like RNA helicase
VDDVTSETGRKRGISASRMRGFVCKDCQREVEHLEERLAGLEKRGADKQDIKKVRAELSARREKATYNENWAASLVERGGSRSDRCKEHRQKHRVNIQGLAVAYIDLQTVGEVANRENPTGPLGGLGPLPTAHEIVPETSYDLEEVRVGMTDAHVTRMVELLREKQVLILKAGTGTGKSTFAPYRLMDPPPGSLQNIPPGSRFAKLTDLGPIIVTEPRVQAAVGVATFVGGTMSGAGGVGPGYPVGYQVSGDRNHDEACELIYVTDGTMINWLREGRLSRIGTVIVDEAHERSTNIDFIMGYLKRELPRYPHLRVIITSATFNTDFYLEYFGGEKIASVMDVPAEKTFGYGMPFFPNLDVPEDGEDDVLARWKDNALPLSSQNPRDTEAFIRAHWPARYADPLSYPEDVTSKDDDRHTEDVWETTRQIMDLRFEGSIPMDKWQERMPGEMAKFVIQLARGLDQAGIFGDILGFLPTRKTIEPVCEEIERALGRAYKDQVFPLISSLSKDRQRKALAKRRKGDARKIVISTNLAETSLTVEGVRFVVDSGIIAQSEWDPDLAKGGIPTKPHSQAGIKQRWGRVGRKAPGWVFPLYTKGQYLELAEDTPPGSTRDNLEALVMTAKMGGIDDVLGFDWPAAFKPETVQLDESAIEARTVFGRELRRADKALRAGGAVDGDGHPTSFGKELVRFQGLGSTASALAIMYADRLACVPEVTTILALLDDTRLIGQRGLLLDDFDWPDDWRLEAAERHRGLASLCADDAELVLLTAAAWERADPAALPWDDSQARQDWARQWWVDHTTLLEAAQQRRGVLAALSPAMKEEVKRFLEPALIDRARGILTRALAAQVYVKDSPGQYRPVYAPQRPEQPESDGPADNTSDFPAAAGAPAAAPQAAVMFAIEDDTLVVPAADHVIALRRRESKNDNRISSLVLAQAWAQAEPGTEAPTGVADAMRLVVAASKSAPADPGKTSALGCLASWPVGQRVRADLTAEGDTTRVVTVTEKIAPFPRPKSRDERGENQTGPRATKGRRPRKAQLPDDNAGGSTDDLKVEIRLDNRRGYDDEGRAAAEFLEADRAAEAPAACGQCFPCQDGRPEDCETPAEPDQQGKREDPVVSWRRKAQAGGDVLTPRVKVEPQPLDSAGWYEITGYHRDADGYIIALRPDWRRGQPGNAAQHPDLKAGDSVDIRVGRKLKHHGGMLREFHRTDGRGRFVLAEARSRYADVQEKRREIAASLDRGNTTLLEGLTEDEVIANVTVVPARAEGTVTITLLELLHQHWAKTQDGRGAENHVLDKSRRNAHVVRVYPAVIDQPPNKNGYATARLLHQDGSLGVIHRFDFNATPGTAKQGMNGADGEPAEPTPPALQAGDAILLNLISDRASLDVAGLDLDALLAIEKSSAGQLKIDGLPDDGRSKRGGETKAKQQWLDAASSEDDRDQETDNVAPPGTTIKANTDRPLPRSAAIGLAGLSDEPDWPNEVWAFWARSHHLKVSDRPSHIPGTKKEPFEVPATVTVNIQTPLEQQRAALAAFAGEHPVYSTIECTVRALVKSGASVDLGGGLEGFIPLDELTWAGRVSHSDQAVGIGDQVRALITALPEPPGKPQLSVKALTPDPYEQFKRRHPVGDRLTAMVAKIVDTRAFVDLGDTVDGTIHISQVDHNHVDNIADFLEEGGTVTVVVVSFDDPKRSVEVSRKAAIPSPYEVYKQGHAVGEKVRAVVESATRSHVYLTHSNGARGVIYVDNLTWERVEDASGIVEIGTELLAEIIGFNDKRQQVELSRKAVLPNLYLEYKARHTIGDTVRAVVTRATPMHVYLRHSNGATGVIYVKNLTWEPIDNAAAFVTMGAEVYAEIIKFNDERQQVELSRKALLPRPYQALKQTHRTGDQVSCTVTNTAPSAAFVLLDNGVQGRIHVGQLANYRVDHPDDVVRKGQRLTATIIKFDDEKQSVELSLKVSPLPNRPAPW